MSYPKRIAKLEAQVVSLRARLAARTDQLPPLPEPLMPSSLLTAMPQDGVHGPLFSAHQMRSYASAALAQQPAQPVAWMCKTRLGLVVEQCLPDSDDARAAWDWQPLYAAPQQAAPAQLEPPTLADVLDALQVFNTPRESEGGEPWTERDFIAVDALPQFIHNVGRAWYATPQQAAPAQARQPLTDEQIMDALHLKSCEGYRAIVSAIEAAHGIKEQTDGRP